MASQDFVKEKRVEQPEKYVNSRIFQKVAAEGSFASGTTLSQAGQLLFKVSIPTEKTLIKDFRVCLPLRIRLKDNDDEIARCFNIAVRQNALDRIFKSVRVRCNGHESITIPENEKHCAWSCKPVNISEQSSDTLFRIRNNRLHPRGGHDCCFFGPNTE